MNEHKIRVWLTNRLQQVEPKCVCISLIHVSGMGPEQICKWAIETDGGLDAEVIRLADAIHTHANDNVESYEGRQRYRICAIGIEGDEIASFTFTLDGGQEGMMVPVGSHELFEPGKEPPTNEGLMAQLMRHNEANVRMIASMYGTTVETLGRRIESLEHDANKNEHRRIELFEILENLKSAQYERDKEREDDDFEREMKKIAFEQAMAYAPALISHFLKSRHGKPIASFAQAVQQEHESKKTNGCDVAQCQAWLRDIVKVIGGIRHVKESFPEEHHEAIENLLGVGQDPKDLAAMQVLFDTFIQCLPPELHSEMSEKLSDEQKGNLTRIVQTFARNQHVS